MAPTFTGPGVIIEIIDINDTNAKVKINNKIKILNLNKLFLHNNESKQDQTFLDYDFNDTSSDKHLTCTRAKLINYKNAAQLALLMPKRRVDIVILKRLTCCAVNHVLPVTLNMTILN